MKSLYSLYTKFCYTSTVNKNCFLLFMLQDIAISRTYGKRDFAHVLTSRMYGFLDFVFIRNSQFRAHSDTKILQL